MYISEGTEYLNYFLRHHKQAVKRSNRLLKAIRLIDRQCVVSFNSMGNLKTCSREYNTSIPKSFKDQISDTY